MMYKITFLLLFLTLSLSLQVNAATEQEQLFLAAHWADDISATHSPEQGLPALETSLQPEACGECHTQQYQDWQTTLHSKAMGPGVAGQLLDMVKDDPHTAKICWQCHAPLQEQQNLLLVNGEWQTNINFDSALQNHGMTCAACHVRNGQHIGPPPNDRTLLSSGVDVGLPHNGFTVQSAFQKAEFCKGCHQFTEDGYALNGKLIENTYNEWQASEYAKQGVQCQDCHMPERRHLWRGIHDVEMTKSAVEIDVDMPDENINVGDELSVTITLKNSGAGHHFPTYLTPKVFVRAYLQNAQGEVLEESWQQAIIGREVTLDLQQEMYDSRIVAGESLPISYQQLVMKGAVELVVEVEVEPDHFYEKFYRSVLADGGGGKGRAMLQQALHDAENSNFFIYQQTFPLGKNPTAPDWNTAQIKWYDYKQGLAEAKRSGKPMVLIFYADWCPTCHAYKNIFNKPQIIDLAQQLIMIRVNVDQHPELSKEYSFDGGYVPRTFVLNDVAEVRHELYREKRYRYFIQSSDIKRFEQLLNKALN